MERLIYEGNSVYELDEEALLMRQKKQMEQNYELMQDKEEKTKDGLIAIIKRKKKGTV